jgi:LPXTG-site transpeptidase (sortase) family protein
VPTWKDCGRRVRSCRLIPLAAVLAVLSAFAFACGAAQQGGGPPPARLSSPPSPDATRTVVGASTRPDAAPRAGRSPLRAGVRPLPPSPPVRLSIPAIGVDTSLMRLGLAPEGAMAVPPGRFPAGWFTGSPTPGSAGPSVIAGHVTYNGPGVFFRLGQLRPGDRVRVSRRDGTTVTFAVMTVQQYAKDAFPTAAVYGFSADPELRLITCSGDYDHAHHRYDDNLVVYARMLPR